MTTASVNDPFDVARLEGYLRTRIEGLRAPLRVEQFKGGQSNPTFLVSAADGMRYVLRKKPGGELLPSAHAVDREYRVIEAWGETRVAVARPQCE